MILIRTFLLTTLTLLMSTGTTAATDWYQVDILIITRLDKTIDSLEAWPSVTAHHMPLDAIKLYTVEQKTIGKQFLTTPAYTTIQHQETSAIDQAVYAPSAAPVAVDRIPNIATQPLIQLPSNDQLLNREALSIKKSRDYRLLYQASWRMALPPESPPVHIYIEAGQKVGNDHELEGIITLSARRFLHAAPMLWFNRLNPILPIHQLLLSNKLLVEPVSQASTLTTTATQHLLLPREIHYTKNFLLAESRRLNMNAINYFDSPSVAVLLTITPYKVPTTNVKSHQVTRN